LGLRDEEGDVNRTLFAAIFGALALLIVADISVAYYHIGSVPALGTLSRINNFRAVFTAVTPEGRASGIRPGDVRDLRGLDLVTRYRVLAAEGEAGGIYTVPLERDGRAFDAHVVLQPQGYAILDVFDVAIRLLLVTAGIMLLARGVGIDSFWAGFFVCSLAAAEGFGYRHWGAPILGLTLTTITFAVFYFGLYAGQLFFALALLPRSVPSWLRWSLIPSGWVALIALLAMTAVNFAGVFAWFPLPYVPDTLYFPTQMILITVALVAFAVAAYYTDGRRARAIRWIFWAMLVSQIGPWINFAYSMLGQPLPLHGLTNVSFLALAIVLPYAVLSQRLLTVNFVVSRALVYTLVLTTIVGTFIVLEKIIENAAIGRLPSQAFELIVAVGLGLSFKWIEGWAERIVERVLYRGKMRAEQELNALVEDFPHARDVTGLATRVAREVCRQMEAPFAVVYRESELTYSPIATAGGTEPLPVDADDPVFLRLRSKHTVLHTDDFSTALPRHSAVFPLVVFGAVTGALVVQSRESSEAYDPDELETLKRVAHELAIALLWVERLPASPRAVPAV
jgi:hypothetical protein